MAQSAVELHDSREHNPHNPEYRKMSDGDAELPDYGAEFDQKHAANDGKGKSTGKAKVGSNGSLEREDPRLLHFDQNGVFDAPENHEGGVAFDGNKIRTSKYTPITFVPLNLWEQVTRPANFYFCMIAVLQCIPAVSISQGRPTILLPLTCVFLVTAIKDVLEDLKRHKDDKAENQRVVDVLQPNGQYERKLSEELHVGDIVRIHDGQRFPADLLLVGSAKGHKAPYCYVETSNIDGETNLKLKQVPEGLNSLPSFDQIDSQSLKSVMNDESASASFEEFKKRVSGGHVQADPPNGVLDQWQGMLKNIRAPLFDDDDEDDEAQDAKLFNLDFQGLKYETRNVIVTADNLLLRGSECRNSDWIYGFVVYTGFECKIFMNNESRKQRKIKRSSVEKKMNRFIYMMAGAQILVCIMCAILSGEWLNANHDAWYLSYNTDPELGAFYKFFTWFIIFAQFIPISLLVSMEMVKFFQAQWMQWDINMYTRVGDREDKFCNVQNSGLNEELGQIEYIFSDKTGTLTENSLDFRKCVIGMANYGKGDTEIGRAAKRREKELKMSASAMKDRGGLPGRLKRAYTSDALTALERVNNAPHVNFDEFDRLKARVHESTLPDPSEQAILVRRFLTVLAVNNSCYPVFDEDLQELIIRAASPDDQCLTCFARFMGLELADRNPPRVTVNVYPTDDGSNTGECFPEPWEQLAELEFTSKRKRMTVIMRNLETKQVHVTMKGADSEMVRFIRGGEQHPRWAYCDQQLSAYSEQGLRTLVVGEAILDPDWWDERWRDRYAKFQETTLIPTDAEKGHIRGSCEDSCRKCRFYEEVEMDAGIDLLGVTAIEDKLQQSVPETISAMLDAGIKVWVLTGDKQKTAENIGIACNLLEPAMERDGFLFRLTVEHPGQLKALMNDAILKIRREKTEIQNAGLVINSKALRVIMEQDEDVTPEDDLMAGFLDLARLCRSVIGVRLQPNQKAQVIDLIKTTTRCITLAVGDGANDEPMIRTANVGVGIAGLEGTAAVRASDYAIGKFKFLKRLILIHGRLHYRRISILICYIFYKNGILSLSSFWFGLFNGFSGQIMYLEWAYQSYNVVFTALPILVFAVIDRDYSDKTLSKFPQIYALTQKGTLFNPKLFFSWIADAFFESAILALIPFLCYAEITSPDGSGQSAGIWSYGVAAYTAVVLSANLRLSFVTISWTGWTHFVLWGSIVAYFLTMIILNTSMIFSTAGGDYYWLVFRLMGTWRYWLTSFLATIIALFVPFTVTAFTRLRAKMASQRSGFLGPDPDEVDEHQTAQRTQDNADA